MIRLAIVFFSVVLLNFSCKGQSIQKIEKKKDEKNVISATVKKKYSSEIMLALAKSRLDSSNIGLADSAAHILKSFLDKQGLTKQIREELILLSELVDSNFTYDEVEWKGEVATNLLALKLSYSINDKQPEVFSGVSENFFSTAMGNAFNKKKRDSCSITIRSTTNLEKIDRNFMIYVVADFFKEASTVQQLDGKEPEQYPKKRLVQDRNLKNWFDSWRRRCPDAIQTLTSAEYNEATLSMRTNKLSNGVTWYVYLFMNDNELKFYKNFTVCGENKEIKISIEDFQKPGL